MFGLSDKKLNKFQLVQTIWDNVNAAAIHRRQQFLKRWRTGNPGLWEILARDQGLYVVDLKRKNLLRRYTSLLIASQKRVWIDTLDREVPELPTVIVDPEQAVNNFENIEKAQQHKDYIFRNNKRLFVAFEDLQNDFTSYIMKIQEFCELNPVDLAPQTKRREVRQISDIVENFDEIEKYFKGTTYEWMLYS